MMKIDGSIWKKGYFWLVQGENSFRHILLLILRVYWGSLLVMTGAGKLFNIQATTNFFTSLQIPQPMLAASLVGLFELLGGISLILGFLTRFFTPFLIAIFITAYFTAHHGSLLTLFHDPNNFLSEKPFMFLLTSLIVFCFGPGAVSFDYWMEKKRYGKAL